MKKITFLTVLLLIFLNAKTYAQITVEILSYPTKFTVDANDSSVFGPAEGENPLVVRISNIPDGITDTNAAPAPIRAASQVASDLSGVTLLATGDCTNLLGNVFNPGGSNFGYTNLHQVKLNNATSEGPNYKRISNGNGTFNAELIHTRFTQASAYQEGTGYAVVQRSFVADPQPGGVAVQSDGSGGYEVAPMVYQASLTIESESVLLSKGNNILNNKTFNKSKLSAYYSSYSDAVIIDNSVTGKYAIYNLLGQSVQNGEITTEISVNTLKSGLYILTTESGLLKFAK